jgi:hypothetical protein
LRHANACAIQIGGYAAQQCDTDGVEMLRVDRHLRLQSSQKEQQNPDYSQTTRFIHGLHAIKQVLCSKVELLVRIKSFGISGSSES